MKKIILLLLVGLLPSLLSAQQQSLYERFQAGELYDEIERDLRTDFEYFDAVFKNVFAHRADEKNAKECIYEVAAPSRGLFKYIYKRTEDALNKASVRVFAYLSKRKSAKEITIAKSKMEEYAYEHAKQTRERVVEQLQEKDNHEELLKIREEWLAYKNQNPVFELYTLLGNFEELQSLDAVDYNNLVAFFTNKEPAAGWEYREYSADYYVNSSPINHNKSVIHGTEIRVRISDNLEANILPENLTIRVYKAPKDTWNTWKNSKSL
ncbi:MAG: hypothetical protein IKW63_05545 [Elusimicrobiaceae bacterium]|nr:hypothetical protein [Elusimicrobiaceae bacterium]